MTGDLVAWNAVRMDDAADIAMKRKALIWRYRAVVWPLYLVAVLASIWLNSMGS